VPPVHDAVAEALAQLGVRCCFGLVGSGNFHVTAALARRGCRFVAARHEAGAITMADAYARVTGEVGVCSVHQGPGFTNTLTGLAEAAKSRSAVLVLAADVAGSAVTSNFRVDQAQLAASVGAVPERLHSPRSAVADAARAFWRARVERRPVVLSMPLDVQAAPAPEPAHVPDPPVLRPARPSAQAVREAVQALSRGSRPLVLAGRGAALAGAAEALERLADRLGGLLATTAVANGLFAGNPWDLGVSGGFASPVAARLIREADVVLAFGASLNMWTTRHGTLVDPAATVVQVDAEPEAIGRHRRVDVAVVGDAREAALALLEEADRASLPRSSWRSPQLEQEIARGRWRDVPYEDTSDGTTLDPRTLSIVLDEILPPERVVATDSGHFMGFPVMYLRVPDARGFVFTQGFQAVGLGLATAVGAAVACPDRLVVAALGDGGALMGLPELETVARLGLRMLVVVYNDAAYGAEVHHFRPEPQAAELVRFPDVDFAALARAVGLRAATVRRVEDLEAVRAWVAEGAPGGMLVDAKVTPTVVAEWLEDAFRGH
jgi:thiamine pyrophosphate-dependent acetolactate synthase large subunit-like protein